MTTIDNKPLPTQIIWSPFPDVCPENDPGDTQPTAIVSHDELTRAGVTAASIEAVVDMASNVMSLAPDFDTREDYRQRIIELIRNLPNPKPIDVTNTHDVEF